MSTLNELAANHAKMAKALAQESIAVDERKPQIVGSFEVPSIDDEALVPLHLMAGVQDTQPGLTAQLR